MKTLLIIFTLIIMTGIGIHQERRDQAEKVEKEINEMIQLNDSISQDLDETIYLIHKLSDDHDRYFENRKYEDENFNPLFW